MVEIWTVCWEGGKSSRQLCLTTVGGREGEDYKNESGYLKYKTEILERGMRDMEGGDLCDVLVMLKTGSFRAC